MDYESKTHQNRAPMVLRISNSNSTRKLRYKTWFKVDKGAQNVCFMTEACVEIVCMWYIYMVYIYIYGIYIYIHIYGINTDIIMT